MWDTQLNGGHAIVLYSLKLLIQIHSVALEILEFVDVSLAFTL